MPKKPKRRLTAKERAGKRRRRREYFTIFVRGKRKRVKRPPTIEGMCVDEFIRRNADPIWLHQNEMWELLHELETQSPEESYFVTDEEVRLPRDEREAPATDEPGFF